MREFSSAAEAIWSLALPACSNPAAASADNFAISRMSFTFRSDSFAIRSGWCGSFGAFPLLPPLAARQFDVSSDDLRGCTHFLTRSLVLSVCSFIRPAARPSPYRRNRPYSPARGVSVRPAFWSAPSPRRSHPRSCRFGACVLPAQRVLGGFEGRLGALADIDNQRHRRSFCCSPGRCCVAARFFYARSARSPMVCHDRAHLGLPRRSSIRRPGLRAAGCFMPVCSMAIEIAGRLEFFGVESMVIAVAAVAPRPTYRGQSLESAMFNDRDEACSSPDAALDCSVDF